MLNAIATVVWPKGFLGGCEFELTLATVAVALAAIGPGEISLDHAFGWADELSGVLWASLVLSSAIVDLGDHDDARPRHRRARRHPGLAPHRAARLIESVARS